MSSSTSYILPHSLTERDATKALFEHLVEGEFTSMDLVTEAKVLSCRKFHIPLHRFHGEYRASYSALVGVTSTETYLGTHRVWRGDNSNGSYHDELVEKQRDVTHWHPVSGDRHGKFDLYAYAGPSNVTPEVQSLFGWFPASSQWRTVSRTDTATLDIEAAVAGFSTSFQQCERDLSDLVQNDIANGLAGDDVKDLRLSYRTDQDQSLVLNPVYHLSFEYKKRTYNVWVHGSDMARRAGDQLPQDVGVKSAAGNAWWAAIIWTIAVPVACYTHYEHLNGWKIGFGIAAVLASWVYSSHKHEKVISGARAARQEAMALRLASLDDKPEKRANSVAAPQPQVPAQPSTTQPVDPATAARLSQSSTVGEACHGAAQEDKKFVIKTARRRRSAVLIAKG